jgi:hypothetical protein
MTTLNAQSKKPATCQQFICNLVGEKKQFICISQLLAR